MKWDPSPSTQPGGPIDVCSDNGTLLSEFNCIREGLQSVEKRGMLSKCSAGDPIMMLRKGDKLENGKNF